MRVMAKITMPVESGNRAVKDGSIRTIMQRFAERWKPEAMYFGGFEGRRSMFIVFDMTDPSNLVTFAEPLFSELNADVVVIPIMTADDLQNGFAKLG